MLDHLVQLQSQYSPLALVGIFALAGVLALAILRNLPWMVVIIIIWVALWVGAMPAGMDAANLVWDQEGTSERVDCAYSLIQHFDYWTGHRDLRLAECG